MKRLLATSLLVVLAALALHAAGTLDVYFINVGHGDAILIDFGERECLIDFGGPARYCPELSQSSQGCGGSCLGCHGDLLLRLVDGDLELAILSHNHWDHYGGFVNLLDVLQGAEKVLDQLWQGPDRGADTEGRYWGEFEAAVAAAGLDQPVDESGSLPPPIHPNLTWTLLSPSEVYQAEENDNRNSLVLLLTFGNVSFLFTGDIQTPTESTLSATTPLAGTVVLKVAHHGSHTSTSVPFLEWADPELAIISGDKDDLHENTRSALGRHGVPFLQTSGNGTICVSTNGIAVWVTTDMVSGDSFGCSED
ncbi:ComEC/Rec2 family competence protein [Candidatus Bipolaricaulota bacterium]